LGAGLESYVRQVMSGAATGGRAAGVRAALATAEPFYASIIWARNQLYDRRVLPRRRLPRPVISVGNLTTGGTGKTPMVRWLAAALRDRGWRVAILSRGYKSAGAALGDELEMLRQQLNAHSSMTVVVQANPDRYSGGLRVLDKHPETDVFVLDDGFQHRRLERDFDLVLVSAVEPFGFGHVLPRGLLREPTRGLRRATAIVLTHADQVPPKSPSSAVDQVRRWNAAAPLYRAIHAQTAVLTSDGAPPLPISYLSARRVYLLCGIADPSTFGRQLSQAGATIIGHRWFPDHHHYDDADATEARKEACRLGAEAIVSTEKDWVKLCGLPSARDSTPPIWRVDVQIQFLNDDAHRLLQQIDPILSHAAQSRATRATGNASDT